MSKSETTNVIKLPRTIWSKGVMADPEIIAEHKRVNGAYRKLLEDQVKRSIWHV